MGSGTTAVYGYFVCKHMLHACCVRESQCVCGAEVVNLVAGGGTDTGSATRAAVMF